MPPPAFEELDYAMTPLGELILRRRQIRSLDGAEVFEVKLDGEFLMSSLVTQAEIALADCALPLVKSAECDVLIGGLGLGYTAKAALDAPNVTSVTVIEYLERVIDWHRRGCVPLAHELTHNPRCTIINGDFFAVVGSADRHPEIGARRFHAILLDIDHSPQCLLRPAHAAFYTPKGLADLTSHLHPDGVFALWSADPPDPAFIKVLESAFQNVTTHESRFHNPLQNRDDVNYIHIAQRKDPQINPPGPDDSQVP